MTFTPQDLALLENAQNTPLRATPDTADVLDDLHEAHLLFIHNDDPVLMSYMTTSRGASLLDAARWLTEARESRTEGAPA